MTKEPYYKYCIREMINFIRWNELIFLVASFTILILLFGWWGILWATLLHFLNHLQGGIMGDFFNEYPEPPKSDIKCVAGHRECKICNDGERKFKDTRGLLKKIMGDC